MQELITIEKESALEVFQKEKGLDPYLKKIKAEIDSLVPDTSTRKGREEIRKMASNVTRSKTYLDKVGKDLVADLKQLPRKIDAERKRMRDTLDKWKIEARQPLTDWEVADEERRQKITDRIDSINALANVSTVKGAEKALNELSGINIDSSFQEMMVQALEAKKGATAKVEGLIIQFKQREELERFKAIEAERKAKELERIEKEQEEKAQLLREKEEAERKAREAEERTRRIEEEAKLAQERAEREKKEAIEKLEREKKEAAERAEREKKEAAERAEREKKEAEARRIKAEQDEKDRIESQRIAKEKAETLRKQNEAHRKQIESEVVQSFVDAGLGQCLAEEIFDLIRDGKIKNVTITF